MTPRPQPMWPMYRALVGVGLLCAVAVVGAYEGTRPFIEANEAEARQAAVLGVVPGATRSVEFVVGEGGSFSPRTAATPPESPVVYAALAEDGSVAGLAFEARGTGYQDRIDLLIGYRPEQDQICGLAVTKSRETPGLGDRIEKDRRFLANFDALDVALASDGLTLAHPIEAVGPGEREQPWQIDTISGATVSSKAVANITASAAAEWVPRLAAHIGDFSAGEDEP